MVQLDTWKKMFEDEYPKGLLASWENYDGEFPPLYRISQVHVLRMIDSETPEVELVVEDVEKTFVLQIAGYDVIKINPLMARVQFTDVNDMIWSEL